MPWLCEGWCWSGQGERRYWGGCQYFHIFNFIYDHTVVRPFSRPVFSKYINAQQHYVQIHHHHHELGETYCLFLNTKVKLVFLFFLWCLVFLLPFGLYFSACLGILFLSILFKCCRHFHWYSCISRTMFCSPSLSLMDWFLSPSNLVIPSKCLKGQYGLRGYTNVDKYNP
jgi:hypothetical protein